MKAVLLHYSLMNAIHHLAIQFVLQLNVRSCYEEVFPGVMAVVIFTQCCFIKIHLK